MLLRLPPPSMQTSLMDNPLLAPRRKNKEVAIQLRLQQKAEGLHEAGQEGHIWRLHEGSWDLWDWCIDFYLIWTQKIKVHSQMSHNSENIQTWEEADSNGQGKDAAREEIR